MHINFSIDGEEITSPEQRQSFAAVLRAVADTLANGGGIPVVTGFRPPEIDIPATTTARTSLVTKDVEDPYLEKPKKEKAKKDKPVPVPDSKDPAQTTAWPESEKSQAAAKPKAEPAPAPAAVATPDADALRAIVNKYTNRFGLAKLRETVTAFGMKKLLDLTDAQKSEWAVARTAELAVPAVEEN